MYNCDQCRLPRVFVSFFFCFMTEQTNVSITHPVLLCSPLITSFCCYILWPLYTAVFHSYIFTSFYLFLSSIQFFFLHINRSFLYCESRTMVMLVIMTFIYHIRSVMPFAHIYLYINTSRPNRLNSIEATSCVNNSSTDQSLTFSLFSSGYSS